VELINIMTEIVKIIKRLQEPDSNNTVQNTS